MARPENGLGAALAHRACGLRAVRGGMAWAVLFAGALPLRPLARADRAG